MSVRRIAAVTGSSIGTVMTILRKDLKLWPYKHQRVQQLKPGDHEKRMNFANLMLYESEGLDFDNIIFTDEAHFYLHGFINRQNNRTWALDNPHVIMETPLHAQRITVWAGLASWGVIGPFYFEEEINGEPVTVTVNGPRYEAMLRGPLTAARRTFTGWNDATWFQQDGAPPPSSEIGYELPEGHIS